MQKSIIVIGIIVILAIAAYAALGSQNQKNTQNLSNNLNWHTDLNSAIDEAKKTGKNVIVDFYAPWCSACTYLDEDTFQDPQVQEKLNKNYIIAKIDIDRNPDLASKYKVYAVPTIIFMDSSGNEIKRQEGYIPPEEFLQMI
ncbi:MAG: thioredoxin family protein [Methanobacterium sp.]|uniref:thioredoxin family protein n=1 Tax=Methanobacterium sp. TaxID=2164 RepID=UPI003D64F7D6|nr:thioredoxin family protein [Methanobacterium sp.]